MTALETMKNWLTTFPLWNSEELYIDYTDGIPEHCGLYCRGLETVSRKEDILGGGETVNRLRFELHRIGDYGPENGENARWLLQFQEWIAQQSMSGLAPVFGDIPNRERIWAEKGRLADAKQTGTARYTVSVTVEFIKLF